MSDFQSKLVNNMNGFAYPKNTFKFPKATPIQPTDSDYSFGYMKRYFYSKVNDNGLLIHEISESQYNELQSVKLYKTISIPWRIAGNKQSVQSENAKIAAAYDSDMKGLKKYLETNLLKYWKDIPFPEIDIDITEKLKLNMKV